MMKLVLDMNFMYAAYTGKDPATGQDDLAAVMGLISEIMACTHMIIVTGDIDRQYQSLFKQYEESNTKTLINIGRIYNEAKLKTGKIEVRVNSSDSLPKLANEVELRRSNRLKDEDVKYARLANQVGNILITYDRPLMQLFDSSKARRPSDIV